MNDESNLPEKAIRPAEAQEPPTGPYNARRIAWELDRTALGDGYYGSAIRAAMDFDCVTPLDMVTLQRYAAGVQENTDHVKLQEIARKLYAHPAPQPAPAPTQPGQEGEREAFIRWYMEYLHTDEMLAAYVWDNEHIVPQTWRAARAQANIGAAPAAGAVAGWQWVPVEPTHKMLAAASIMRWRYDALLAASPTPPAQAADSMLEDAALPQAARDVLAERQRQISTEGWTPEHDDEHSQGEMAEAAACYAASAHAPEGLKRRQCPGYWPWAAKWWKPSDTRRDLIKAGALILAELERIDRAAMAAKKGDTHE